MIESGKKIIEAGLNYSQPFKLFPTLIVEDDGQLSIHVLESVPDSDDELFEAVMQWKREILASRETVQPHCVGFMASPDKIALGVFPPLQGDWHYGHIHRREHRIEWTCERRTA
jgi:hypothetical protein